MLCHSFVDRVISMLIGLLWLVKHCKNLLFSIQTAFRLLNDVLKGMDLKLSTATDGEKMNIQLNNVVLHQSKTTGKVGRIIVSVK